MRHLILCREYPPAVYPPGGIGTYVAHISRVLAERGEVVHVIGERWEGAGRRTETLCDGRLIVHRIASDDTDLFPTLVDGALPGDEMQAMLRSDFAPQWFSWVAAGLAERLIEQEDIDVIEAQEWEAPLYYFLLRRSLGLGPDRKPPCITHLHSPTEYIFRANDWPLSRPAYFPMKRLEDFVIKAADAHLCPSHFLAGQCAQHYGLADPVKVIPLPLGGSVEQSRSPQVWQDGTICFSGRLEPRKGIIEFVDAAIPLARDNPELRFDFIGSDNEYNEMMSVQTLLEQKITADLRGCFRFHGGKPRDGLLKMLGGARIAVVPSRWENFPNTCLEAMSSGLPVVATRNGGMAEMIEHGVTGWLAPDGPEPLAERIGMALGQALSTPPERLAAMGREAALSIRSLCDNDRIARSHIEFRQQVARGGSRRSHHFPTAFPWPERPARPREARQAAPDSANGTAVVIVALHDQQATTPLQSIASQTRQPATVIMVGGCQPVTDLPHRFLPYQGGSFAVAKQLAMADAPTVGRWLFLDADTELHPAALEQLEAALAHVPSAGIAVAWCARRGAAFTLDAASPSFPYQWHRNDIATPALYRAEAIEDAGGFRAEANDGHEDWELATAMMARGWATVRVPALLAERGALSLAAEDRFGRASHAGARIAARFPDLVGADAPALLLLLDPPPRVRNDDGPVSAPATVPAREMQRTDIRGVRWILTLPVRDQARLALAAAKRPDRAVRWLIWRASNMLESRRSHGAR